jgi:hypothetical protein
MVVSPQFIVSLFYTSVTTAFAAPLATLCFSFSNNKLRHQIPVMIDFGMMDALTLPGKVIKRAG